MILKNTSIKIHKFSPFLLLIFLFLLSSFIVNKDEPKHKVKTIVIDPGHGGKDPGCSGVSHNEKEVALLVALKLEKYINENIKDVKVILTRRTDVFVELEDRALVANNNNADLFISIHCNAAGKPVMIKDSKTGKMRAKTYKNKRGKYVVVETTNPEPFGSETYVMGLKNEDGKMKVAQRENSAMLLEDNYETKYKGFDPNSEESYIIMSNYTSSYVIQSAGLALKIQDQYLKKAGRVDKGVHRQSIWVLWRTSMPSVLTEIGYLTNPQEEQFLGSDKGQDYVAACLFRAFRKYKDEQEGAKKIYDDAVENQTPLANENYIKQNNSDDKNETITIDKPEVEKDVAVTKDKNEEAEQKAKEEKDKRDTEKLLTDKAIKEKLQNEILEKEQTQEKLKKYKQLIVMADMNFKNKNYTQAKLFYTDAITYQANENYPKKKLLIIDSINSLLVNSVKIDSTKNIQPKPIVTTNDIVFKIQFFSSDKILDAKTKFATLTDVWFYKSGLIYKYTSGAFTSFNDATQHQTTLRNLGFKDCFVAAFKNGQRMDINEAKKIVGSN